MAGGAAFNSGSMQIGGCLEATEPTFSFYFKAQLP